MRKASPLRWFLALLVVASCVRNPATGERQFSIISRDQEIEMGEQGAQEVRATLGLVEDPELQRYVSNVGKRLAARSEEPDLPWEFGVIDDPTPNAFALPGGKIFITRGLLVHMQNEAQMASVLGHEIGHVTARHSAEQISKATAAQVGLGIGAIFAPGGEDLLPIASAGLSIMFLKFGRDDEYQADQLGIRYASRAEYDVRQMPGVFAMLGRVSEVEGGGRVPEWLSTHPNPENRIERIEQRIEEKRIPPGGEVAQRPYLQQVEGLVYGSDPRQGYFDGNTFYHPELKFQMAVPEGWQHANYPQAVVAASPDQDAMIQLTGAQASDPESALRQFSQQEGVRMGEPADLIDDLPAASATFVANAQEGVLRGIVSYVALGGGTFELLAVAPAERFDRHAETLLRVNRSLAPLTDEKRLDVTPARVELVQARETTDLKTLYARDPAATSLERIALLNQLEPTSQVKRGTLLKWVRGGRGLPEEEESAEQEPQAELR